MTGIGTGLQPRILATLVNTIAAAFILGIPLPPEWDGVPVYEAFGLPVERQSALCE